MPWYPNCWYGPQTKVRAKRRICQIEAFQSIQNQISGAKHTSLFNSVTSTSCQCGDGERRRRNRPRYEWALGKRDVMQFHLRVSDGHWAIHPSKHTIICYVSVGALSGRCRYHRSQPTVRSVLEELPFSQNV